MADIIQVMDHNKLSEEEIRETMGELFFAYRAFTGRPDALLSPVGLGRAHHRVLYFVARNPGIKVGDLLEVLQITKQSLARVLKELIERDYVAQQKSTEDGRVRHLSLTPQGAALEQQLADTQGALFERARANFNDEAAFESFRAVLQAMMNEEDLALLSSKSSDPS